MSKKGIDVSKHQGNIDWKKVKNDGIEFAILRVGYGKFENQKDIKFEANYTNAKANGIPVGVYHYSYAKSVEEAEREARLVLKWLNGRHLDLPVYYDLEDKSQQNLGKNTLNEMCKAFCNIIEAGGYWAGIYTNKYWATSLIDGPALGSRYTYWIAQYNDKCTYKGPYAIWQYSSSGKVDGISGRVDMDYLYQDLGGSKNGSKPTAVQKPSKKSNEEIADEVIAGKWGNQPQRQRDLEAAGYNYETIRNLVNAKLGVAGSQYYKKYTGQGVSIVNALNAIGVNSSFDNRKKIANKNGVSNYRGTASQNTFLLNLLKNGKLKK